MSANNVVQGPWGSLPPSPDDKEVGESVQSDFLLIMATIMDHMENRGIDTLDEVEYTKDLALIAESIRSYLYKVRGKYHPNQDIADNLFYWDGDRLNMQPSLIVEFGFD
jgi:hypothetical protein